MHWWTTDHAHVLCKQSLRWITVESICIYSRIIVIIIHRYNSNSYNVQVTHIMVKYMFFLLFGRHRWSIWYLGTIHMPQSTNIIWNITNRRRKQNTHFPVLMRMRRSWSVKWTRKNVQKYITLYLIMVFYDLAYAYLYFICVV